MAATGRGQTSEGEKPRDGSAWNKADRAKAEQGVERLRKPVDAAQSGQVSPAQVAAFIRRRRRAKEPQGRVARDGPGPRRATWEHHERTDAAHTLDASEGHERMWVELHCTTPGRGIEDREGRVPSAFCCKAERARKQDQGGGAEPIGR